MNGLLSMTARDDQVLGFQDIQALPKEEGVNAYPDFLIGASKLLAYGHNCTRAFRVVLMEPAWKQSVEMQGYYRINRIGQENPMTYSYRLTSPQVPVENTIMARQKRRVELVDLTYAYNPDTSVDN